MFSKSNMVSSVVYPQEKEKERMKKRGQVTELRTSEFEEAVLHEDGVSVVEFYAPWCVHCKEFAGTLERFASEHPQLSVFRVDAGEETSLANGYRIMEIPTVIVFDGGKQRSRHAGTMSDPELRAMAEGTGNIGAAQC